MKIVDVKVWKEDFQLSRPYTIAFRTVTEVSNLLIELKTSDGMIGLGAGSPEPFVTGETFEKAQANLTAKAFPLVDQHEINRNFLDLVYSELKETPAACAALDMAIFDLLAKEKNLSLCQYLGQKIDRLPTSITIGIKPVEEVLLEGREYLQRGFKIIKLKLGKNYSEDLERTFRLRETVGNEIKIRVDLNQGYTIEQTENYFNQTQSCNIEFVEQPIAKEKFAMVRQLPQNVRQWIAADETLQSPTDALKLTTPDAWCGIFNIKLMKCGGIHPGLQIASIAEKNNIDLMWGCMDESQISIAAALHAAFACINTKYIDLDGHLDLGRDLVQAGFKLIDGFMEPTSAPGLGWEKF